VPRASESWTFKCSDGQLRPQALKSRTCMDMRAAQVPQNDDSELSPLLPIGGFED
jgi:hypothetical protein